MACLANSARLVVIDTVWGHTGEAYYLPTCNPFVSDWLKQFLSAGGGSNPYDVTFIQAEISKFLAE
jgi:hypothetical protein